MSEHGEPSNLPWDAMAENNDKYYDTSRFLLPVPLKDPDTFSTAEVFTLAEHFAETATVDASDPFVFRSETSARSPSPTDSETATQDRNAGSAGSAGKRKGDDTRGSTVSLASQELFLYT